MQDDRGYCFIAANQPNGITPILSNDTHNRNFYIPEIFPDLELYIERTNNVEKDAAVSSSTLIWTFNIIFVIISRYLILHRSQVKTRLF